MNLRHFYDFADRSFAGLRRAMRRDQTSPVERLLKAYDHSYELRVRFPQAFVAAHDQPAFLDWLIREGRRHGFSDQDTEGILRTASRRPGDLVRSIYLAREDVQRQVPNALDGPVDPRLLTWLRLHGIHEHDLDRDVIRWFEREHGQHLCQRIRERYARNKGWQERHPNALKATGQAAFLADLRTDAAAADLGLSRVESICLDAEDPRIASPKSAMSISAAMRPGALVAGHLTTESGVGELSRTTYRSLASIKFPVAAWCFNDSPQRQADFSLNLSEEAEPMPSAIIHLNADQIVAHPERLDRVQGRRAVVGYWAWEVECFPARWVRAFEPFNEIWTCSRHSAEAIRTQAPIPVVVVAPGLAAPPAARGSRADFALVDDEFVVLSCFDALSITERKNPLALIAAFRSAFRADDRARLLLKIGNGEHPDAGGVLSVIARAVEGLPVRLLTQTLARRDQLSLISAVDVCASLHRAEGFGLFLAEAMSLGKPVVATGYSGNTDFMTSTNSWPVPCRMVEIPDTAGPYAGLGVWAEPDAEAAAAAFRSLKNDPERARRMGEQARKDVTSKLSLEESGRKMVSRLALIADRPADAEPPASVDFA